MNILVTGGAGYIGSHTCKALAAQGHQVTVLDNLSAGHRWAVQWGEFVHADMHDRDTVRRVLRERQIEGVMHFAAFIVVPDSVRDPRSYFENNSVGTLSLLNAMLDEGVKNFVFSSTAAVYGNPVRVPLDEDHPKEPINPYGDSKLVVERVLQTYSQAYGLRAMALRYFNACGASPDGDIGEAHDPETHLVPLVIQAALGFRPAVKLFGTDYPTADGSAVRDYIHVGDLASAHIAAVQYLSQGGSSGACNLGTGHGYSVRQVIDAVQRVTGLTVPVEEHPRREGDPPELVASPQRAKETLGWHASHTLDSIVESAFRWERDLRPTRQREP